MYFYSMRTLYIYSVKFYSFFDNDMQSFGGSNAKENDQNLTA